MAAHASGSARERDGLCRAADQATDLRRYSGNIQAHSCQLLLATGMSHQFVAHSDAGQREIQSEIADGLGYD